VYKLIINTDYAQIKQNMDKQFYKMLQINRIIIVKLHIRQLHTCNVKLLLIRTFVFRLPIYRD